MCVPEPVEILALDNLQCEEVGDNHDDNHDVSGEPRKSEENISVCPPVNPEVEALRNGKAIPIVPWLSCPETNFRRQKMGRTCLRIDVVVVYGAEVLVRTKFTEVNKEKEGKLTKVCTNMAETIDSNRDANNLMRQDRVIDRNPPPEASDLAHLRHKPTAHGQKEEERVQHAVLPKTSRAVDSCSQTHRDRGDRIARLSHARQAEGSAERACATMS